MDKRVVPARVRLAIIDFDIGKAPRGAVSRFCQQHQISRSVFYKIKSQAEQVGETAALSPLSRRPKTSPKRTSQVTEELVIQVRQDLKRTGWDAGPLSVESELQRLGYQSPSRATLARIFSRNGQVKPQPKKRPRSSYKRFVYPQPNDCWQLDCVEFELDNDGGNRHIYQVEDDNSRMVLSWNHDVSENGRTAILVFTMAIEDYGMPRRVLTDNSTSFNSTRRGLSAPLEAFLTPLGVEMLTGRPGKPTTQGKSERLHQTLIPFLEAHRPINTCEELDQHLADFADHYNRVRPHQELGRITPAEAWAATPKAEPPIPLARPQAEPSKQPIFPRHIQGQYAVGDKIIVQRKADKTGKVHVAGCHIYLGKVHRGQLIQIELKETTIQLYDENGDSLGIVARPAPGGRKNLSLASQNLNFVCH